MAGKRQRQGRFFRPLKAGVESPGWWIDWTARLGYLAKGIVYALVGLLAVEAAWTAAKAPDAKKALDLLGSAPLGRVLLAATGAGLLCYVAWRGVQAFWDVENKGRDAKGIVTRVGYAVSGLANLGLAGLAALAAWYGQQSDGGDARKQRAAATVMSYPGGWIVVMAVGLTIVGVGLFHFYRAWTAKFMDNYKFTEMSDAERRAVKPIGVVGMTARGVTFSLIGGFIAVAGWRTNAGEVGGLADAFNTLARQPLGWALLGLTALGFVAYGVYCLSMAKYKRIAKP